MVSRKVGHINTEELLIPYVGSLILLIFAVLPSSPAGAKYDPVQGTPPANNPYPPYPPQNFYPPQDTYPPQSP